MKDTMKQINILAILPYEGMKEMLTAAAKGYSEIVLSAFVGDLEKGVEIVKKQLSYIDCDMMISRGGTAELLKKEFPDIPVLEIPTSFEDVFRAVLLARNYREKFAIVSFPAISRRAEELIRLLQYDIEVHTIHSQDEVQRLLKEMKASGYTMVVGDVVTAAAAKYLGMNAILITSGRDSIDSTLNQAKMLYTMRKKTTAEDDYLRWMLQTVPLYTTVFDEDGRISFTNIREEEDEVYFSLVRSHLQSILKNSPFRLDCQAGEMVYRIDTVNRNADGRKEVIVYGRRVFQEIPGKKGGILLAEETDDDSYAFESPFGVTNSVGQAREAILKCCESRLPVLILGEPGTGKDAAANSIHHLGYNHGRPYYIIDCGMVTNKEWNNFFEKATSPLLDVNCTIYFKNIHTMPQANEKKLRELIEETNLCKRNQVIFSAVVDKEGGTCQMADYILENVKCVLLQALPIRQRKEDVRSLSVIYLSNLNAEFGRQIIGFEPGAEDALLEYQWPGNVTQLKRVLRELVAGTEGCYITRKSVLECIRNEMFVAGDQAVGNINLNQTLEDITYDVIRMVLKQEDMNQKRAAERLNVSRSTIWRILKSRE